MEESASLAAGTSVEIFVHGLHGGIESIGEGTIVDVGDRAIAIDEGNAVFIYPWGQIVCVRVEKAKPRS